AMETRSEQNKWTCQTVVGKIHNLLKQIFRFAGLQKVSFVGGLRSKEGPTVIVCLCRTEADLCIARTRLTVGRPRIVVTGDSDLLGYRSVDRVLRSIPRSNLFAWYTKADVLAKLGLPSALHLVLLAIVVKNDYDPNVKTLGIATNCKIISKISRGPIDRMLDQYVQQASLKVKKPVNKAMFDASRRIFFDMSDTPVTPTAFNNDVFVNRMQNFERIKAIRATVSRQARSGINFYVPKGSKRNQFRHIFSSKDTILHKRKEVNLDRVRKHDRPEPSKGPATKRRKRLHRAAQKKQRKIRKKAKKKDGSHERNLQQSTKVDHGLRKKYVTKALKVGSIHGNLLRTMTASHINRNEAKAISDTLQNVVMILNKIQMFAYEVIALDITSILNPAAANND
ncbi:hypothetical protein BGX28_001486, partial [Mortierella sp. GBA30]